MSKQPEVQRQGERQKGRPLAATPILSRYPWVGLGTQRKYMVYRHVDGGCMESNLAIDGRVLVDFGGRLTILDDPEIRAAAARYVEYFVPKCERRWNGIWHKLSFSCGCCKCSKEGL